MTSVFRLPWAYGLLVIGILAFDWILLGARARRAWALMATISIILLVWMTGTLKTIQAAHTGEGIRLAAALFLTSVILSREMFISRARYFQTEGKVIDLVRSIAIAERKVLSGEDKT